MKRVIKKVIVGASVVHVLLWVAVFVMSVVGALAYSAPEREDIFSGEVVYGFFAFLAVIGIITATPLFFSLRRALSSATAQNRGTKIVTLCCSAVAAGLFYSVLFLLFGINRDWVFIPTLIFAVGWLLCELICGVLLVLPAEESDAIAAPKQG